MAIDPATGTIATSAAYAIITVTDSFFRFLTFYPFADKNSVVSLYFIVEKRVFCGDI